MFDELEMEYSTFTLTFVRDAGMTPERAIDLCRYFISHRHRLNIGVGKLVNRLKNDRPQKEIHKGWGEESTTSQTHGVDAEERAKARLRAMPEAEVRSLISEWLSIALNQIADDLSDPLESSDVLKALAREMIKREGCQ